MINTTIKHTLHAAFIFCFFSCSQSFASAYDTTASVLRFQIKMAERGVAEFQYKLGYLHETGSGAEQNLDTALHWYKKASTQGYQPASNRIVYLQIKRTGMNQQHNHWLSTLKSNAQSGDKDALFLLGQMYAEGTGVNKSLTLSLDLLRKAARKNMPDTEAHIMRIERELAVLQQKYKLIEINKTIETLSASTTKVVPEKSNASDNLKSINKDTDTVKSQRTQQPKPVKKAQEKSNNQTQIIRKEKPRYRPTKNELSNIPVTHIAATPTNEPEYSHPMEMICGGSNRLLSGCR